MVKSRLLGQCTFLLEKIVLYFPIVSVWHLQFLMFFQLFFQLFSVKSTLFPASDSGASPAARRQAHLPVSPRGVPAPGSGVPRGRATVPRLGRAPASAKSPVMDRLFWAPWMFDITDITDICKHVFSSKLMELISVIDWSDFRGSSFMLLSVLSYEGLMRLPSWRSTCSFFLGGYLVRHIAKDSPFLHLPPPCATRSAELRFQGTAGRVIEALEGQNAQVVGSEGLTSEGN